MNNFLYNFYTECLSQKNTYATMMPDGEIRIMTICPRSENRNDCGFGGAEWTIMVPSRSFANKNDVVPMNEVHTNNVWHRGDWENVPEAIREKFIAKGVAIVRS